MSDDLCKTVAKKLGFRSKEKFYAAFGTSRQAMSYLEKNNYQRYEAFLSQAILEQMSINDPLEVFEFAQAYKANNEQKAS